MIWSHCSITFQVYILMRGQKVYMLQEILVLTPLPKFIIVPSKPAVPNIFGTKERFCGRQFFCGPRVGGWFQDDSST